VVEDVFGNAIGKILVVGLGLRFLKGSTAMDFSCPLKLIAEFTLF
jgi:hypothetical protein